MWAMEAIGSLCTEPLIQIALKMIQAINTLSLGQIISASMIHPLLEWNPERTMQMMGTKKEVT
jgi:hypothetical protein